ncbi:MAG TPA: hypothetical protein VE981_19840, partial [Planctomycetota bacterium]|nr:hypothetical protein [Planctomycetota bacterium]
MDRDDLFIILALKARLLSPAQVEDCRRERQVHGQNAAAPTLPEIVAQKEYLNPEQRRLLNIAIQYEELKLEDAGLAAYIVRKGYLKEDQVAGFLAAQ